jgi:hypothetical protein
VKVRRFLLPALLFLSSGAVSALTGAENPTASAEGKVVDEAGLPFQGARIELHPDPSHADSGLYQATSGPDGLFRISGLPADSWFTLRIARRGFTVLVQGGIASSPEGGKAVLGTFRLPKGQTVAGRVVDSKGHPLAGAQVWALSAQDDKFPEYLWHAADGPAAVTGPDGRYEIHGFEPGRLEVCREGFSPHKASAESSRPSRVVMLLFPLPSRMTGRVVDDRGLPITKAKIQLRFDYFWKALPGEMVMGWSPCPQRIVSPFVDREKLVTLSDRMGRFTFEFELAGEETMRVEAEAAGYLRRADLKVSLSPRSPKKVEIVLERGAIVSGRVLTTDGLPAASAEISFSGERNGLTTPAETDGEGRYRIAGIEPGNQTMEVKHPSGQASSELSIAPGENRRPDLILDGNGRVILGRVTGPDGEPIASASIFTSAPGLPEKSMSTAADGSFRLSFRRSLTDEIEIGIQKAGYANRNVRLDPAQPDLSSLAIRLDPEVRLTGHILGVDPASLFHVEVEACQGHICLQSSVRPDGEYRIAGLGPGDFDLTARFEGRCGDARVALETGMEAVLDLVIPSEPRPSSVEVRGKILGPDGEPVAGTVIFESVKGSPACEADVARAGNAEDDGSFLTKIPPGRYTMTGEMPGYARTVQEQILTIANDPVENLEVRLKPESRPSGPPPP